MKIKTFIFFIACSWISIYGVSQSRPNIIFIMSDDISPKEYALYGGTIASPVLEMMAEEGLFFKTAWATPRCIPTRALLLTGKYPFRTRVFENQVYPRNEKNQIMPVGERYENTLGSLMSANGYRTAMIGKIQTGTVQSYGFQHWCLVNMDQIFDMRYSDMDVDGTNVVEENVHSTDFLFKYLRDFTLEEDEKPWFVYMPLNLPHSVRNPDNPTVWGPPWVPVLDENWELTGELVQNDFEACVRYIDYKIGGFIEHLDSAGQLNNTIIIYAGDNGTNRYGKSNPDSEKGPRVPFVVYAPGYLSPMGASDELVDFTDVVPTCVELAGGTLPASDTFDGHSFAPLILGQPFVGREWIFSQWFGCRWLRTKRWLIDGRGMFYDCGENRNEWVPGAYEDVTYSTDEQVISVRKELEKILMNLPAPDFEDPELASQWEKEWFNTNKYVDPYIPPYLQLLYDSLTLQETIDSLWTVLDSASVGSGAGEYAQELFDMAIAAVIEAENILDTAIFQSDVDAALEALIAAVSNFVTNPAGIFHTKLPRIMVYPNPTSNTLRIDEENAISYKICNINGKALINNDIVSNRIDVTSLCNGIYFIEVKMKDNTLEWGKFIKYKKS